MTRIGPSVVHSGALGVPPPGSVTTSFELMIDVAGVDNELVVTVDVFDSEARGPREPNEPAK